MGRTLIYYIQNAHGSYTSETMVRSIYRRELCSASTGVLLSDVYLSLFYDVAIWFTNPYSSTPCAKNRSIGCNDVKWDNDEQ